MKKKPPKPSNAIPAVVPGQALGYNLQSTRLTMMLLEALPGSLCSLEVLGDAATQSTDGSLLLVESKSALRDNPVSDHAKSLWKTFSNWLVLIEKGIIVPEKTVFEIYVSRQVCGEIVESFHNAHDLDTAEFAYNNARTKLWGTSPQSTCRTNLAVGISRYVKSFFECNPTPVLTLISRFHLRQGNGSPLTELETMLKQHPISDSRRNDIRDKLLGWVKQQVDARLEKELPAVISRDAFHTEYTSFTHWADRDTILKSFAPKPSLEQQASKLSEVFVRQLDLIGLDFNEKLGAISDFLRASADRTIWSQAGYVHKEVFEDLASDLVRIWRNILRQKLLEHKDKVCREQGEAIYAGCMLHQTAVQGMVPPGHFVPGCFHGLADDLEVGWHPNYRTELGSKSEGSTS